MIQSRFWNIVDRLTEMASSKKTGDLEQIESLLQGVIEEVKPRNIFKKELGDRLVQRVEDVPVEIEGLTRTIKTPPQSFDFSMMLAGIISGLLLIIVGVGLLIHIQGRSRSPQM